MYDDTRIAGGGGGNYFISDICRYSYSLCCIKRPSLVLQFKKVEFMKSAFSCEICSNSKRVPFYFLEEVFWKKLYLLHHI